MLTIKIVQFTVTLAIIVPTVIALVKGAPFVPTPLKITRRMLELAKIRPGEKIYDIGCGDGRMVHLASKKYQAEAVGFELSPLIYFGAKICQPFYRSKAKILFRDSRKQNLGDADVIFCYMMPESMQKFQEKFDRELKKGARVISYAFQIKKWKEVQKIERIKEKNEAPIWVYEIGKT